MRIRFVSRGRLLLHRMNSERIGIDPRMNSILNDTDFDLSLKSTNMSSEDCLLYAISAKVYILHPNVMEKLIQGTSRNKYSKHWKNEMKILRNMEEQISVQFPKENSVNIVDVGFFSETQKCFHQADVMPPGFETARITALASKRHGLPSMEDLFVACSTITSWMQMNEENVVVLLAPNHDKLALLLSALEMYCSEVMIEPASERKLKGEFRMQWYYHTYLTNQLAKLHTMQKVHTQVIHEFAHMLELRDQALTTQAMKSMCMDILPGCVALPEMHSIQVRSIHFTPQEIVHDVKPMLLVQNDKNEILYTSLATGIHHEHGNTKLEFDMNVQLPIATCTFRLFHCPFPKPVEPILQGWILPAGLHEQVQHEECAVLQQTLDTNMLHSHFKYNVELHYERIHIEDDTLGQRTPQVEEEPIHPPHTEDSNQIDRDEQMARLLQAEMDRLEQLQTNNAQAIIQEERETSPDNLVESALHTIAGVAQGALAAWTSIVHAPSRRPPPSLSSIRQLPVYPYDTKKCGTDTLDLECLVCQHEYKDGDGMKRLPCFHAFHAACIDPWLAKRGTCPICLQTL